MSPVNDPAAEADAAPDESLWATAKRDFATNRGAKLAGVIAMLAWMAFQWGWGNDILLPPIAAGAFDAVDDGATWTSAVAAVVSGTGAGALFWGFTQALDGVIVLTGLSRIPHITDRIARFLRRQGWVKPFDELSFGTKFLIAYASGASVLCLVDVFATGRNGLANRRRMLAQAVGLAVAGVGFVVAIVTTLAAIGSRFPATASTTDWLVGYARNPLTWLVIYGSVVAVSAAISRLRGPADE